MPKVTIKFNLPEEQDEFDLVNSASKYYSVLWNFDRYLRDNIKYAPDNIPQIEIDTFQKIRDELWDYINEHNLDLDK